ncbi:Kelch repeat-containing protein [Microbulbifer sp.]|uniref:Kelch repeat-containing protein n=1 Tax=Microbulbifer sp. TaxID=1908541 RepID=UPI003F400281
MSQTITKAASIARFAGWTSVTAPCAFTPAAVAGVKRARSPKPGKHMERSRRDLLKLFGATTILGVDYWFSTPAYSVTANYSWGFGQALEHPIQEIYPAVFNDEIYVGGGFVPSDNPIFYGLSPSRKIFIYNPIAQAWRPGETFPEARHHLGMVSSPNYLYGIGGFFGVKGGAWQVKDNVYRISSGKDEWESAPSIPIPMAESIYASSSENIHVIGGKTVDKHSERNVDTNSHYILVNDEYWEKAAPATVARNSAAGAALDDKIFVIGGRKSGKTAKNFGFSEFYNVKDDRWEPIRPLPIALSGLTAVALNGNIIVAGGEAFGANGNWKSGKAFSQVWSYDPTKDSWKKELDMPQSRHGHGAVTINNSMYIIGGGSKVGPQETLSSLLVFESA